MGLVWCLMYFRLVFRFNETGYGSLRTVHVFVDMFSDRLDTQPTSDRVSWLLRRGNTANRRGFLHKLCNLGSLKSVF